MYKMRMERVIAMQRGIYKFVVCCGVGERKKIKSFRVTNVYALTGFSISDG